MFKSFIKKTDGIVQIFIHFKKCLLDIFDHLHSRNIKASAILIFKPIEFIVKFPLGRFYRNLTNQVEAYTDNARLQVYS